MAEIVGQGCKTGPTRTIASEMFRDGGKRSQPCEDHCRPLQPRLADPVRAGGNRRASSGEEEAIADGERGIERELPPHRPFPSAPFTEDRLALRDGARGLEVDHGGAVVRHRRDRRQHRRAEDERKRAEDDQPAPGSHGDEQSRQRHR